QVDEFWQESVEFTIRDDRRGLDVIEVVVVVDFLAEFRGAIGRRCGFQHGRALVGWCAPFNARIVPSKAEKGKVGRSCYAAESERGRRILRRPIGYCQFRDYHQWWPGGPPTQPVHGLYTAALRRTLPVQGLARTVFVATPPVHGLYTVLRIRTVPVHGFRA